MDKRINYKNLEDLKQSGSPIIIFKVVREAEAIANACHDMGIAVVGLVISKKDIPKKNFVVLRLSTCQICPNVFQKQEL